MTTPPELSWLPEPQAWSEQLKALPTSASPEAWAEMVKLANTRLDLMRTIQLDRRLGKLFAEPPAAVATKPVRLAILGSSTLDHLLPGIRLGALRRGLHVSTITGDYGQYTAELMNPASELRQSRHAAAGV